MYANVVYTDTKQAMKLLIREHTKSVIAVYLLLRQESKMFH